MKPPKTLIWLILSFFLTGCGFLQRKAMHGLPDGFYRQIDEQHNSRKVYAEITEDSITIYPLTTFHPKQVNETAGKIYFLNNGPDSANIGVLVKTSFDLSLTSVLFKYRFSTPTLPNQLSANFNGAV
jgi:hypothetical protein